VCIEYITTLEEEINGRDTTISQLQEEVISLKSENKTLRTDLDVLKKTVEELLNKARPLDHPPEPKFNPVKDRSPFATASSSASWANSMPSINVHTTFVPSPTASALFASQQRRNMNPLMDKVNKDAVFHLPGQKEDDSFFGANPFTLDGPSLDRYRSQLYSSLTNNLNQAKTPLPGFKPSFFSALASTESDSNSAADQAVLQAATLQTAFVAQEAASTLLKGLLKSFWSTFSGSNPHTSAEGVADLLAGRAELKIVSRGNNGATREVEDLNARLQGLSVASGSSKSSGQGLVLFGGRKS
jgi:FtsZ-binding cell division protein ZapB